MATSKRNAPAAGASGGRAPLPATFFPPRFSNLDSELPLLVNLKDPVAGWIYVLIKSHCVFKTGEFLGSYARLMALMTPDKPERGKQRSGPSYKTVRRCIDDLEKIGLLKRSTSNEAQGQLRLWLTPPSNTHIQRQKIPLA